MLTSEINEKGKTTIPREVREALDLSPGDLILYEIQDGNTVCLRSAGSIFDHAGSVQPSNRPEDFRAVREKAKSAVASGAAEDQS
mgnify:CR=1 FL=1